MALAGMAGVHMNVVGRSERGVYNPTVLLLQAIAIRLNVSLEELLAGLSELRDEFEFHLIWARPCFEALLLRHLPGCQGLRPVTSAHALTDLRRVWPEYEKGMPALRLARKLALGA
jgi:transcriptional regulator with XRE-family HTH domain